MSERPTRLSGRVRLLILLFGFLVILFAVNGQIMIKEDILENGEVILLRLAPRDPRSLLQGDYMALRYAMADEVARAARSDGVADGRVVIALAADREAGFVDLFRGQTLAENQRLLRFRKRGDSVRLASDAYFFEEGRSNIFADAGFGELRVGEDGEAVLTALRDREGNLLGEPLH